MKTYRTVDGDAFDGITWKIWGHEHMAAHLINANPEHADVVVFEAGVELNVPDVKPETTVEDLPPWFRSA